MRYVQGKGSRKARTRLRIAHRNRNNEQFPDYFGQRRTRRILLLQFPLLHSAKPLFIYLINDLEDRLLSLSKREKERRERRKLATAAVSFYLHSHSRRIRSTSSTRHGENEITYYLNILCDTPGKFSTPFIVNTFPTKGDRSKESLGRGENLNREI